MKLLPYFSWNEEPIYYNNIPPLPLYIVIKYLLEAFYLQFNQKITCFIVQRQSLPIPSNGSSVKLKEGYQNIKIVLQKICYQVHQWSIHANFKIEVAIGVTKRSIRFVCL